MPSREHEILRVLFQNRPDLAPALLHDALGVEIPEYSSIRVESADLTDVVPTEYRADLVVLLLDSKPVQAIVVEVQLAQDDRKIYTWPVYVVGLRARFECPAAVLVVTSELSVARWAKRPIAIGPGASLSPWGIGPEAVPVVVDPVQAERSPELAVLSAMAHGRDDVETVVKVASAAISGVRQLRGQDHYMLYNDLILAALSKAAGKAFEMTPEGYRYQSPIIRDSIARGFLQGRAIGHLEERARSVLEVLEIRGISVSPELRARIAGSTDLLLLICLLRRAMTVPSTDELFPQWATD